MKLKCKLFENNSWGNYIFDKEELKKQVEEYMSKDPNARLVTFHRPDDSCIRLEDVCGKVENIKWEDNSAEVDIEVLNTPLGKTVQNIASENVTIKVSPIGYSTCIADNNHSNGLCTAHSEKNIIKNFTLTGFNIDL